MFTQLEERVREVVQRQSRRLYGALLLIDVRRYLRKMRRKVSAGELRDVGLADAADALDHLELQVHRASTVLYEDEN